MNRVISKNMYRNKNVKDRLCCFSSLDYMILASTLAIAFGEELSDNDVDILAAFFAVLADELALISSINACTSSDSSSDDESSFVPPVVPIPPVASGGGRYKKNTIKKKKKIKRKVRKKI